MAAADFAGAFEALKALLTPYEAELRVLTDKPGEYVLIGKRPDTKGKDVWFGGVRSGKAYVSYHFMPVYAQRSLLEGQSEALSKRMQGKSCWNFKAAPDDAATAELAALTRRGFDAYREAGLI